MTEASAAEPPKTSGFTPAVEGEQAGGVTPAAGSKATGSEQSPWEGMTAEVSPWEGMTGSAERTGRSSDKRGRAVGRGTPAAGRESLQPRHPRVSDADSNVIVRSGDRDSTIFAMKVRPVAPHMTDQVVPAMKATKEGHVQTAHAHAWLNARLCSVTPDNLRIRTRKTHEHGFNHVFIEFTRIDVWFCPDDLKG